MPRSVDSNDSKWIAFTLRLQQVCKRAPNIAISNKSNPQEYILSWGSQSWLPPAFSRR
jgi:hypothetical protein